MSPVPEAAREERDVAALASIHMPRSVEELDAWLRGFLAETGMEAEFALFQVASDARCWTLEAGNLRRWPCQPGQPWQVDDTFLLTAISCQHTLCQDQEGECVVALPLRYRATTVGWLVLAGAIPEELRPLFDTLGDHVAIAFTNLRLFEEVVRSADAYYGSLVAYQELDHLLRAGDIDGVVSGILQASLQTLGSNHGAVFLVGEDGRLAQRAGWGIPDGLFESLLTEDGEWWLDVVYRTGAATLQADPLTGQLPGLDPESVRPGISSIAAAPLRHENGTCGVVVVLNAPQDDQFAQHLQTFRGLCSMGAAIVLNRQLHDRALLAQRYEEQLRIAQTIQDRLRPQGLPHNPNIEAAYRTSPAEYVAGDYLDLLTGPDGTVHAVLADVSGHGVGSALLMCSFRADFRSRIEGGSITRVMEGVNTNICSEVGDSGMFITAFYARLQADGRRCEVVNAGHNPAFLLRRDGRLVQIEATAPPLGMIQGVEQVRQDFALEPGDVLLVYSDGITEATNDAGEQFGEERLEQLMRSLANRPASDMARQVFQAVYRFLGRESTADDASVIVVKLRG